MASTIITSDDETEYDSDQDEFDIDDDADCSQSVSGLELGGRHRFYACYLLVSQSPHLRSRNRTYIGFTVDPGRRIRQHNGELKAGGARRTSRHRPWKMVAIVHGFSCKTQALSFEWAWTNPHLTKTLHHLRANDNNNNNNTKKKKNNNVSFPRTPRGRIHSLFALCASRPWRTCPLALSVLISRESWDETLTTNTKSSTRNFPVCPPTLEVEYVDLAHVSNQCKQRYDYRENLHSLPAPPYATAGILHIDNNKTCLVCHKNVDNSASQPRTQCYHCGRLACLTCIAACVATVDHAGADDRLVPDVVFCLKCKKSMHWALVTRLSCALSADAAAALDLPGG